MVSVPAEKNQPCQDDKEPAIVGESCAVFPVESGTPIIGLGILLLAMAVIPALWGIGALSVPAIILFGGFGFFLIWLGLTR